MTHVKNPALLVYYSNKIQLTKSCVEYKMGPGIYWNKSRQHAASLVPCICCGRMQNNNMDCCR